MVNFKIGNHDSSFTRAAMRALLCNNDNIFNDDSIGSNNELDSGEEADEFGME